MDVLQVLGIVGLVLSIPAALGAALALMRSSYNKAQVETLRGHNADLRARVDDLEDKEQTLLQDQKLLKSRVTHLETENGTLREMVTQRADLQAHHEAAMENFDAMATILGEIVTVVKGIKSTTEEVLAHVRPE